MPKRWSDILWAVAIAVVVVVVFGRGLNGPFIFDDHNAIVDNPHTRTLWPITDAISAPDQSTVDGRPVVALSLAVNFAIGRLDPWGYHAVNIAIHALCAVALFGVLGRITGRRGLALAVAAIWAVHPLHTESVTYIVQRSELMMTLFYLLTVYSCLRGFSSKRGRRAWFTVAIVCCALGMASKEVMVSVPIFVLLLDRAMASGSFRQALRQHVGLYAGLAATWAKDSNQQVIKNSKAC